MLGLWATSGFSCSSNNPVQICLGSDIRVLNVAYSYVTYSMYSKMAFLGSLHVDRLFVSEQNPTAVILAQTVREMLEAASISIRPLKSLVFR